MGFQVHVRRTTNHRHLRLQMSKPRSQAPDPLLPGQPRDGVFSQNEVAASSSSAAPASASQPLPSQIRLRNIVQEIFEEFSEDFSDVKKDAKTHNAAQAHACILPPCEQRGSSPQASRKPLRGASMLRSRINLIIPPVTDCPSRLASASYAGIQDKKNLARLGPSRLHKGDTSRVSGTLLRHKSPASTLTPTSPRTTNCQIVLPSRRGQLHLGRHSTA